MKGKNHICDGQAILFEVTSIIQSLAIMFKHLESFEINADDLRGIGLVLDEVGEKLKTLESVIDSVGSDLSDE